jgi:uncharacterized protein
VRCIFTSNANAVHLFLLFLGHPMTNSQVDQAPSVSLVIEHIVPKGKGLSFRFWHGNLTRSAKKFKGYIRTDLCPPVKGSQLKWHSIIHFDSPEHLNIWIKSDEREKLIESGKKTFESYQFKSFSTGLEGWFSPKTKSEQIGLGPPAWKQTAAVLFGLYPTVMIQSLLFSSLGVMKYWPLSNSMLVNNLITCSLLTWVVMPLVTRSLGFWLQPAHQSTPAKTEILGAIVIVTSLGLMASLFNLF